MIPEIANQIKLILSDEHLNKIAKETKLIKRFRVITGKMFLIGMLLNTINAKIGTLSEFR